MQVFDYMNGELYHVWPDEYAVMERYKLTQPALDLVCKFQIKASEHEFIKCDMSFDMMFRMQSMLEHRVGVLPVDTQQERTQLLVNHSQYLDQELHEMLRELPHFKPWKKYDWSEEEAAWRKDLAKDEAIDAFHFMLNILLLLDITPEELVNRYVKKNTINHVRQDNNY